MAEKRRGSAERAGRGWQDRLFLVGEVLLLGWVLGIFSYFYHTRGYLELVRQLLGR